MKCVLDSCVALKWVLPEQDSDKAIRLRDEYRQGIHELLAPDVFVAEIAHALARAERRKLLQPNEGEQKLMEVHSTPPKLHSYLPLVANAFALSTQFRIGFYDCLYLALAEQEYVKLLSSLP